jgi:hypothetical protein
MQEVENFARFYAAMKAMPGIGDREEYKRTVVAQYTGNRTESLREMTRKEYNECCEDMERITGLAERRRKERSACLKLMQRMGIDTTDWTRVNNFCRSPRIAGRDFAKIDVAGLEKLQRKLRAIMGKPASQPSGEGTEQTKMTVYNITTKGEA